MTGAAFALFRRWRIPSLALGSLALASLVFYCWWKPGISLPGDETLLYVLLGLVLILGCPNAKALAVRFRPSLAWSTWTAVLFGLAMLFLLGNKKPQPEFLYFNF